MVYKTLLRKLIYRKKINKKGELVRRYKQNYKFEYLDLDWNENPLTIEERDTNLKTENLLNQKIKFLRDQELARSNENSKKFFSMGIQLY